MVKYQGNRLSVEVSGQEAPALAQVVDIHQLTVARDQSENAQDYSWWMTECEGLKR